MIFINSIIVSMVSQRESIKHAAIALFMLLFVVVARIKLI